MGAIKDIVPPSSLQKSKEKLAVLDTARRMGWDAYQGVVLGIQSCLESVFQINHRLVQQPLPTPRFKLLEVGPLRTDDVQ